MIFDVFLLRVYRAISFFQSKDTFERFQAKFTEPLRLSHVREMIRAIEVEREITSDSEELGKMLHAFGCISYPSSSLSLVIPRSTSIALIISLTWLRSRGSVNLA
ncbi:MAG: hypothetical protein AAGG53_08020, partial [Cyanobacteria bacterium P01_H01_bin.152]